MKTRLFLFILILFLPCVLVAQERGMIKGLVYDALTQEEISSTPIKAFHGDSLLFDFKTDERGEFTMSNLYLGQYALRFEHADYKVCVDSLELKDTATQYHTAYLIPKNDTLSSLDYISLHPGIFRGFVHDSISAEPVPFATIKLYKGDKPVSGVYSDFEGFFMVEKLKPATYRAVFECVGYDTLEMHVDIQAGEIESERIHLGQRKIELPPIIIDCHSGPE